MEPVNPGPSSGFLHQPLDPNGQSIRLLRVLPDLSGSGLMQCEMWHDTTSATYTCLSYVWGSEEDQRDILINGNRFRVRRNLWKFLKVALIKYSAAGDKPAQNHVESKVFWIDALCIDQSSIAERNSQVSFMGSIYSKAEEVIGWLGAARRLEQALRFWINFAARMGFEEQLGFDEPEDDKIEAFAITLWHDQLRRRRDGYRDWHALATCDYWERAWITQEVLLAHRFTLLVNDLAMEPAHYAALQMIFDHSDYPGGSDGFTWATWRLFPGYVKALGGDRSVNRSNLISLILSLPGRGSQIPRDIVYSLRGLATDGETITVDYASSDEEFVHQVISTFRPSLCVCTLYHLSLAFPSLLKKGGEGRDLLIKLAMRSHYEELSCESCQRSNPSEEQQRFSLDDLCAAPNIFDHLLLEVCDSKYYINFDSFPEEAGVEVVLGLHLDNEGFECLSESAHINLMADGDCRVPVYNIYVRACDLLELFRKHYYVVFTTDLICEEALHGRGQLADCLYTISPVDASIKPFHVAR